jgi:hypothetical protein
MSDDSLRVVRAVNDQKVTIYLDTPYLLAILPIQMRTYLKISISICAVDSNIKISPSFSKSSVADFNRNEASRKLRGYRQTESGGCSLFIFEQIAFL